MCRMGLSSLYRCKNRILEIFFYSSPPQVPGAKFGADFAVTVVAAAASFEGGPGGASAAADGPRHSAVVPGSNPAGLCARWFARA